MSDRVRDSFVARFGEQQALMIENAALEHYGLAGDAGIATLTGEETVDLSNRGDNPFQYDFLACIGFECITRDEFRDHHGITVPALDLHAWAIECGDLGNYKGAFPDYLALVAGMFTGWLADRTDDDDA